MFLHEPLSSICSSPIPERNQFSSQTRAISSAVKREASVQQSDGLCTGPAITDWTAFFHVPSPAEVWNASSACIKLPAGWPSVAIPILDRKSIQYSPLSQLQHHGVVSSPGKKVAAPFCKKNLKQKKIPKKRKKFRSRFDDLKDPMCVRDRRRDLR